MALDKNRVCVGALSGPHGIKGDVRLKSFTGDPEAIKTYGALESERGDQTFTILSMRQIKGGYSARLEGINDRNTAETLEKTRLFIPRDRLPEPEDNEYYHSDLVGLKAYDAGGAEVGEVRAVFDFGAGDLLDIFVPGAKTTLLVPFTAEEVPTVDIAAGRVVIDPKEMTGEPEGQEK